MDEDEVGIELLTIDLIEIGVAKHPCLTKWKYYRIDYGDGLLEGHVWLPPKADPSSIEALIVGLQAHGQIDMEVDEEDLYDDDEDG